MRCNIQERAEKGTSEVKLAALRIIHDDAAIGVPLQGSKTNSKSPVSNVCGAFLATVRADGGKRSPQTLQGSNVC